MLKIIFGILSFLIVAVSFIPYIKDVLKRNTTPHIYSWLVWTILQTTAAVAILQENQVWSALGTAALGLESILVFLLCFKYGTKNIALFDVICLIGALLAIGIWVFVHNAMLSIILVTIIDFVGFLPTYRKAYREPQSETLFLYICSALSNIFSLLSITHHSVTSSLYVLSLIFTNTLFVSLVFIRRRSQVKNVI
jgi:hypothetical protein